MCLNWLHRLSRSTTIATSGPIGDYRRPFCITDQRRETGKRIAAQRIAAQRIDIGKPKPGSFFTPVGVWVTTKA
jgi:hypothetical protein